MVDDSELIAALEVIQARGAIGERSLVAAVAHAVRFVDLIPAGARTVIDLGSGGGLPALVISWRRPDLNVTMVERRATRADLLRRAVASMRLDRCCAVLTADVSTVCAQAGAGFDVVTARSFADLDTTTRFINVLLAPGGTALISEPPTDRSQRWAMALAQHPDLVDDGLHQGIRRLTRRE